jgi:hypothetical protein
VTLFDADPVWRDAIISDCGRYRYRLSRVWDECDPVLVWVMVNPSTADALTDDPTIRRCISFARDWGYGGIVVVNLFALRATDPAALNTFAPNDPIGPLNNDHLLEAVAGEDVVCAWGASIPDYWRHRPRGVVELMRQHGAHLHHLGLTKSGQPRHPLYLAGNTERTEWSA